MKHMIIDYTEDSLHPIVRIEANRFTEWQKQQFIKALAILGKSDDIVPWDSKEDYSYRIDNIREFLNDPIYDFARKYTPVKIKDPKIVKTDTEQSTDERTGIKVGNSDSSKITYK